MTTKTKRAIIAGLMSVTLLTGTATAASTQLTDISNVKVQNCSYDDYCDGEYFEATFYNNYGITASGCTTFEGGIAVDPSVIPLGSTVYVEFPAGYEWLSGSYTAIDTGGAVYGNIIDIFLNLSDAELYQLGRVAVKVYR